MKYTNNKLAILISLTIGLFIRGNSGFILSNYSLGTCVPNSVINIMNPNTYAVCCDNETNHIILSLAADRKTLTEATRFTVE